jgi:hypothetical protein
VDLKSHAVPEAVIKVGSIPGIRDDGSGGGVHIDQERT